jgi:MFS family permease
MWTGLAFHLGGAPFHYSTGAIGLFGLIAVGGVVAANIAGRQADQARTRRSSIVAGMILCAGFVIMLVGARSIPALALGIILIDVGTQGMQITNQAIVYTIAADMRSRINAAYMLSFFTGGAIGSVATGAVFMHFGWTGTCFLGLGFGLLAVLPAWLLRSEPVTTPATEPSR